MEQQNNQHKTKSTIAIIPWVIIGVLLTLLLIKSCPGSPDDIKAQLQKELEPIKTLNAAHAKREKIRLEEQKTLQKALEKIQRQLPAIQTGLKGLEKKLATRPAPENSQDFKTLPECREKYDILKESYTICLDLEKSREEQLNLFSQVNENLTGQKEKLLEAVDSLQTQTRGLIEIEKSVKSGMEKIDRAYKLDRTWRDMKYAALGIGVGVAASAVTIAILTLIKALKK